MSTSTPVDTTVSVPHEALLDAVAALHAADQVLVALNGDADSNIGNFFMERSCDLRTAAFPEVDALQEDGQPEEVYATDPVVVETAARADEMAADVLLRLRTPTQLERALSDEEHYALTRHAQKLARNAEAIRANGTINVLFPSE